MIHILNYNEAMTLCRKGPGHYNEPHRVQVPPYHWNKGDICVALEALEGLKNIDSVDQTKRLKDVDCPSCILHFLGKKVPPYPPTPEHDKVTASNDLPQKLCEFVKEFLPEHGITLGEHHHHNEFCEDEEGDRVCGLREGALLLSNKDVVSLAAEFIGVDRKAYDKEKDAALAYAREMNALHEWARTEGRRLIDRGRYP